MIIINNIRIYDTTINLYMNSLLTLYVVLNSSTKNVDARAIKMEQGRIRE